MFCTKDLKTRIRHVKFELRQSHGGGGGVVCDAREILQPCVPRLLSLGIRGTTFPGVL